MNSLPRFNAIHNVPVIGNGHVLESYGTVTVEGGKYWFRPDGTPPTYGYWIPAHQTVLLGRLPDMELTCECQPDFICQNCYDSAQVEVG